MDVKKATFTITMNPMPSQTYIGRFAPSPTGPMHFGTMVAAVASFLQAKTQNGLWLLRIEDVDITRTVSGANSRILKSLEAFGFEWDGEVVYQSLRTHFYETALECLLHKKMLFPCTCSRKELLAIDEFQLSGLYPGTCRDKTLPYDKEHAVRLRVKDKTISFTDSVMGDQQENIARECGDFIIKRRDGLFAYQLAVVVDDALQGVTEVVRGNDLLHSTARQIYLQQQLGYATPLYMHLPLVLGTDGKKLSKSTQSTAINENNPTPALFHALLHLGQKPPVTLKQESLDSLWQWAIQNWNKAKIPKLNKVA